MPKLSRVTQLVFGNTGDQSHFGQFGSRAAGSPVFTKDPATIQSLTAFVENGIKAAINSGNKAVFLEDLNSLFLLCFRQIAYLFEQGIPEWDAGTTYYVGSIVKKAGTFEQYGSQTDGNFNNALPSQTDNGNWKYLNPAPVPAGVMSDFGGTSAPFGYLLCDGSSYAAAAYPGLFAAIGYQWGGAGANFNVPDMRGRASIGSGTGSGLTARTVGQLIGEEAVTLVIGEMPVHAHTDAGHAHTVQVNFDRSAGPSENVLSQIATAVTGNLAKINSGQANIQTAGGGGAHNNMQPSGVVMKIIKT